MVIGLDSENDDRGAADLPNQDGDESVAWSAAHGQRLQRAREGAGMTQQDVEQQLEYTTRSVTRWENGKSEPHFGAVQRMASLYGVSLDWIAGRTDIQPVLSSDLVIVNSKAKPILEQLVLDGKTQDDVPKDLLRHPGIDYVFMLPQELMVMKREAAEHLDQQVQDLWKQLPRKKK